MRMTRIVALAMMVVGCVCVSALAQDDTVEYVPRYTDPELEAMRNRADSLSDIQDSITSTIRKRQKAEKEAAKKTRQELRFDVSNIAAPSSPEDFTTVFHFPPVAQYNTGTCWSFSATSFLESEVYRQTGRKIKLSEMHTVYYEYLEKARRYVRERGASWNGQGSEGNAVTRIMKQYGAVPYDVYSGLLPGEERYDHSAMSHEIADFLAFSKDHNHWNEADVLAHVRIILNRYMGEPPTSFTFEKKTYTPQEFLAKVLKLKLEDYVDVVSTLAFPFHIYGPLDVPDNWTNDSTYYNLPLDEWYGAMTNAIEQGYSVELGGDVSEPGWYGKQDLAIVPDFDIPQDRIDQNSRELRIYNHTTTDDHGLHLVGHTQIDGRDWFLLKDSGRSGRWGKYEGYYFMRDDYIRLKMLAFTVHRDLLPDILTQTEKPQPPE